MGALFDPVSGEAPTSPFETPEQVAQRRKLGMDLATQASSVAPLNHWTQALARVLQGGVGGYELGQADRAQKAGQGAANSALRDALAGNKSATDTISTMLSNPWSADTGRELAGRQILSQMPDAKLDREIKQENLKILQRKENPRYGEGPVDAFGQPTKVWIDDINQTVKPATVEGAAQNVGVSEGLTGTGLPHGDEFLKTLPGGETGPMAVQVKKLATGQSPWPAGFAASKPYFQRMITMASQYDPTFDATKYTARNALRRDYEGGTTKNTIAAGNTAIQHLGEMSEAIKGMDNFGGVPLVNSMLNQARNLYQEKSGDATAIENFRAFRDKYVEEATKFYRGIGGAESDIQREIKALSEAKSPAELQTQAMAQVKLMAGKINALQDRWKTGMGEQAGEFPLIDDKSRASIGKVIANAKGAGLGVPLEMEKMANGARLPQAEGLPQRTAAPVAQFRAQSPEAQRGAIMELGKDPSPQNQQKFREVFGDDALQQALTFIQRQRGAR